MFGSNFDLLAELAIVYLTKRQLQGRPTTLRQLSKRVGVAASRMLDYLEVMGVRYALIAYEELGGRKKQGVSNTEVLLRHMPPEIAKRISLDPDAVEESFRSLLGEDPQPVDEYVEVQEAGGLVGDTLDPFAIYRIDSDRYEVLRNELITFEELVQVGREHGYSVASIRRATGGDRMRYPLPSFFWRPYVLGKKRFYLKDVIDHLEESDRTYKSRGRLDRKRIERIGDPNVNKYIQFSRPKKSRPRKAKRENV